MNLTSKLKKIININDIYIEKLDPISKESIKLYGNKKIINTDNVKIINFKKEDLNCKIYINKKNNNIKEIIEEFDNFCDQYLLNSLKSKINYFSIIDKQIENKNFEKDLLSILKNVNNLINYNQLNFILKDKNQTLIEHKITNADIHKNIKTYHNYSNHELYSEIILHTTNSLSNYEKILMKNIFNKITTKLINQTIYDKSNSKTKLFDIIHKLHIEIKDNKYDLNQLLDIITNFGNKINYKINIGLLINDKIYIDHKTKRKSIIDLDFKKKDILYTNDKIYLKLRINQRLMYLATIERKMSYLFEETINEEKIIIEGILKNTYLSQSLKNITHLNKSKINILSSLYELNKDFNSKNTNKEKTFLDRLYHVLSHAYEFETLTTIDIFHNHIIKSIITNKNKTQEKILMTKIESERLQNFPKIYSIKLKSLIYNLDRYKITIPIRYKEELISIIIISSKFKKIKVNIDKRIESIFINNLSSLIHSNNSYIKLKKTNIRLKEMVDDQNKKNKQLLTQYQAKSDFLSIMLSNIPEAIIVFDVNNKQNNKLIMFNQKAIKNFTILPEMSYEKFKERNGFKEEIKNDVEIFSEKLNKYYKIYEENLTEKYLRNYMGEEKYYEGLNIFLLENITRFKELDNLKSDFISNISHEFRTPLTSISGYTNLILMEKFGKLKEEQQEALKVVSSEAKRLSQLINDVLDVSKLESGKIQINKTKVNIANIAKNINSILKGYSNDNKVKIINEINNDTYVYCDENKIQQVLINLIDNAIKYNSKNGWVKIKYKSDDEWDNIIIEDNGIGISEENAKHLFDKFYQVESIMFKSKIGTGLGLSIVKQIIDLHGGKIDIESKLNKGTKFIIKLKKN